MISSIKCEPHFKKALEDAIKDNLPGVNVAVSYNCSVSYDPAALAAAVQQASSDNSVGMIVTLGGLVTFVAANNSADNPAKPFISLIGGTPPGVLPAVGTGNFYGAVSLESYAGNPARIAHLGTPPRNFLPAQITLLYNPLSVMSQQEISEWTGGNKLAKGDNDDTNYAAAISAINTPAVIVSADPFFHHSRDALIKAANNSFKFFCYPLENYRNRGGTQPAAGRATLHGPKT